MDELHRTLLLTSLQDYENSVHRLQVAWDVCRRAAACSACRVDDRRSGGRSGRAGGRASGGASGRASGRASISCRVDDGSGGASGSHDGMTADQAVRTAMMRDLDDDEHGKAFLSLGVRLRSEAQPAVRTLLDEIFAPADVDCSEEAVNDEEEEEDDDEEDVVSQRPGPILRSLSSRSTESFQSAVAECNASSTSPTSADAQPGEDAPPPRIVTPPSTPGARAEEGGGAAPPPSPEDDAAPDDPSAARPESEDCGGAGSDEGLDAVVDRAFVDDEVTPDEAEESRTSSGGDDVGDDANGRGGDDCRQSRGKACGASAASRRSRRRTRRRGGSAEAASSASGAGDAAAKPPMEAPPGARSDDDKDDSEGTEGVEELVSYLSDLDESNQVDEPASASPVPSPAPPSQPVEHKHRASQHLEASTDAWNNLAPSPHPKKSPKSVVRSTNIISPTFNNNNNSMPPDGSPLKRKDEMRMRLQKKLNSKRIDYYITIGDHSFIVPVSMKPDQMALLDLKGQEGCQLLNQVMHPALRDVLTRLPWQCTICASPNATHTFGAPIYVPAVGSVHLNELERVVRESYRDSDTDRPIDEGHIRDQHPAFYCGSADCLAALQKAAGATVSRLKAKRDESLEKVEYRATYGDTDYYALIRLSEAQIATLDGRGPGAAVILDRCMIPGLKLILKSELSNDQPRHGPWNCMICNAAPATEVYGSPMWIPDDGSANETEKFVREHFRPASDGDGYVHHHMRDKAPYFHCGSNECKQEVHRRIDRANRDMRLSVRKKVGKGAPSLDSACCCSCCGNVIIGVKDTCPHCRGTSYCNRQCREKAWPTHRDDCIPVLNERSPRKSSKQSGFEEREKAVKEFEVKPMLEEISRGGEKTYVKNFEIDLRDGRKHKCKFVIQPGEDPVVAAQRLTAQLEYYGLQHDLSLESLADLIMRSRSNCITGINSKSIADALVGGDTNDFKGDLHAGWF